MSQALNELNVVYLDPETKPPGRRAAGEINSIQKENSDFSSRNVIIKRELIQQAKLDTSEAYKYQKTSIFSTMICFYIASAVIALYLFDYHQVKVTPQPTADFNRTMTIASTPATPILNKIEVNKSAEKITTFPVEFTSLEKETTQTKATLISLEPQIAIVKTDTSDADTAHLPLKKSHPEERIAAFNTSELKKNSLTKLKVTTLNNEVPAPSTQSNNAPTTGKIARELVVLTSLNSNDNSSENKERVSNSYTRMLELNLDALLTKFTVAYTYGDLARISSLVTTDIKSNDTASKEELENEYRKLFNITSQRSLDIIDVKWNETSAGMTGEGAFRVSVLELGANQRSSYTGNIRLQLKKQLGKWFISELNYQYSN